MSWPHTSPPRIGRTALYFVKYSAITARLLGVQRTGSFDRLPRRCRWRRLRGLLDAPARDRAAQLEVGDGPGHRRQPEGDRAVREHRQNGQVEVNAERDKRTDHAALDAAKTPRKWQQVAD